MKRWMGIVCLLFAVTLLGACVSAQVRHGQRLFAGCVDKVDDRATLESGEFVCDGGRDREPFGGNGRACGDCHVPGDNFGISQQRIAALSLDHPFFFDGIDEDPARLRSDGLVHVVVPGQLDEFRRTPKLVHLQKLCDEDGNCDALGLLGDRVRNLCVFSTQPIINHMSKTLVREPGLDFRLPTQEECAALVAYMISDLVAEQDERAR